jgi:hypothetical protein
MKPVLQALVLAERIYQDYPSNKKIIAGTFNQWHVGPVPQPTPHPDGSGRMLIPGGTDPGCPSAYISLTDVVDGTKISLQFVDLTRNHVMFGVEIELRVQDRLATVEAVAPLPPIFRIATEPGVYTLDVVWEGEILGSHRVRVIRLEEQSS